MQQPHARAPRNAVQSPAAVGTFSSTSLPRSGSSSSSSASSYTSDQTAEHSQFESDATATNRPTCTDHNATVALEVASEHCTLVLFTSAVLWFKQITKGGLRVRT